MGDKRLKNGQKTIGLFLLVLVLAGLIIFGISQGRDGNSYQSSGESQDKPALVIPDQEEEGGYSRALAARNQKYEEGQEELFLTDQGKKLPAKEKEYTIMIYMVGSNLESRFGAASEDLKEISQSGYDKNKTNVIVYTGGSRRWNTGVPSTTNNVIDMGLSDDQRIVAATKECSDMGSPNTFSEYINFCSENYPAKHYALICWNHGGGPLWGYGSDELFGNDSLLLPEIQKAMNNTVFANKKKLDWVGFDACLMGSLESASIWQNYASYMVASEEVEAGDGWDYSFLSILNETSDPEKITGKIVENYGSYYADNTSSFSNPDVTLAVTDLGRVTRIETSLDQLYSRMEDHLEHGKYIEINKQRRKAKLFGLSASDSRGNGYDLLDLGSLMNQYKDFYPEETQAVLEAVSQAVISQTSNVKDTCGLSIYFPGDNQSLYLDMGKNVTISSKYYENYYKFTREYTRKWMDKSQIDWKLADFKEGKEDLTLNLTKDQVKETAAAYYNVLTKNNWGSYNVVLIWKEMDMNEDGSFHIPHNPDLITVETDQMTGTAPWGFRHMGKDGEGDHYKTINCFLTPGQDFQDIDTNKDLKAEVLLSMDGKNNLSIDQISEHEDKLGLAGKNTLDVNHYKTMVDGSGISYEPTRYENGEVKPFYEWTRNGFLFHTVPLDQEFRFISRKASAFDENFFVQVIVQDVNGDLHFTGLHKLETGGNEDEVYVETDQGKMTFHKEKDHAVLTNYQGKDKELKIPEKAGGLPVTKIGSSIFYGKEKGGNETVTSILCPASLREIGPMAFLNHSILEKVTLNEGLTTIGYEAFSSCSLTEINLPESLKSLGRCAFAGNKITRAELPASLLYVGFAPFKGCGELKEIHVAGKSTAVSDLDGVLFSSDKKTLIQYPPGKGLVYQVPDGTEEIAYGAFGNQKIEKVSLPETLKKIDTCAFFGCENLQTPEFPESLTEIGDLAFGTILLFNDSGGANVRKDVVIPKNVAYVGDRCFEGLYTKAIKVDKKNKFYASEGGFLMNKEKETILEAPRGMGILITVPDGVIGLEKDLFYHFSHDSRFILPDSLFRIPEGVFPSKTELNDDGSYTNKYDIIIYASKGSAAETYADQYGIYHEPVPTKEEMYQGQTQVETDQGTLTFELYGDHGALIHYEGEAESLKVPDEVDGKPVTVIGDGKKGLQSSEETFSIPTTNMKTLILSENVKTIRKKAFDSLLNLTEIQVAEDNKVLKSQDGVLFSRDGTELIAYPRGKTSYFSENKSYTVPDGVETIRSRAFEWCELEEVIFPDSLETIGEGAFYSCDSLQKIQWGKGLSEIKDEAFYNVGFTSLDLPSSLKKIGKKAFYNNKFKEVVLPEGLEEIGTEAFLFSDSISKIVLPDSLKVIGARAFYQNPEREKPVSCGKIIIPKNVKTVGPGAFNNLLVKEFEVDGENKSFSSKQGMLLSKKENILYACPDGGKASLAVPDTVKKIRQYTFSYGGNLKDLSIPESVVEIDMLAFEQKFVDGKFTISMTIHCPAGSYAAEYAENNGFDWTEN